MSLLSLSLSLLPQDTYLHWHLISLCPCVVSLTQIRNKKQIEPYSGLWGGEPFYAEAPPSRAAGFLRSLTVGRRAGGRGAGLWR